MGAALRDPEATNPLPFRKDPLRYAWAGWLILVVAAIVGVLWLSSAQAEPIYRAEANDAVVVLHDDPCAQDAVVNLKKRATWTEKGKTFEGCWGVTTFGVVVMYFDDKTVSAIPVPVFVKVQGS